jgi:type VI secretion system ImpC/EvpB family protein
VRGDPRRRRRRLVEDLPTHTFKTDEGEVALKCPTEIAITDRREKELSDLGFISLVHCKNTDYAAFFGAQSAQKAKKYNTDAANANAVLSSQLQYIFAVSRIAHYMKAMMRDKIGSFAAASNVEDFLNRWMRNTCCWTTTPRRSKSAVPAARSFGTGVGSAGTAWCLSRRVVPASAFSAG